MEHLIVGVPTRECAVHSNADAAGALHTYLDAIQAHGMVPILIPHTGDAALYMDFCHAFLLTGGEDVIGRPAADTNQKMDGSKRDGFEIVLVTLARERKVPILGICRGLHVLNAAFGGSLASLPLEMLGNHRSAVGVTASHSLTLRPGAAPWGDRLRVTGDVPSRHSQVLDDLCGGATVIAHSHDGIVEALEFADWDAIGVQWHCEMRQSSVDEFVWAWLADAAKRNRDKRRTA